MGFYRYLFIYTFIFIIFIYILVINNDALEDVIFLRGSSSEKYVMNKRRLILILEFFSFSLWDIIMKKSKMTGLPNLKNFAVFSSLPNI